MSIGSKTDLDSRRVLGIVRAMAVGLVVLAAGAADSLDEYLVIVNRTGLDVVVSYRPGVFRGSNMEAIAMLQKPLLASSKAYGKIRKYWVLPDERIMHSSDILTFTLPAGEAAMVGGIWPPSDDPPTSDGNDLYLRVETSGRDNEFDSQAALAVFSERSRDLRIFQVR